MCGIAGWVDWERDLSGERPRLDLMARAIAHRGPDAQGIWVSQRAALAHRRLIVIDPEAGGQPMLLEAGGKPLVITFNGEIYNFQELRGELTEKGHSFRSRSDTEVLLHAYLEWGEDCTTHLNGIFAFAVWDEARQQLFMARDHLGVKPLFYAQRGSAILFGSEIKALLAHPLVRPVVTADGMAQVFGGLTLHTPGETVYQDVYEVKPGHSMMFRREGALAKRYWQLESAPHTDDLETTVSKLRGLLADTVKRQLVADVPVSTMLSGGLDSSGITALVAREFGKQKRQLGSYTIDFVGHEHDFKPNMMHLDLDTPWAKKVAQHVGADLHMVIVDYPALLESFMVPTIAHDRPGMGQMETSLYLLCKAMKQDATVALSGESADEVFGGYPWFNLPEAVNAKTFPWLAMLSKQGLGLEPYLSTTAKASFSPSSYVARRYEEALADVPRLKGEDADAQRRREILYLNQTRFLPVLLDRKDRMSMAVGFEVRVPFCDHRLVQYVWNIPWAMKRTGDIEKGVLRRALEDVLPHDALYRRKSPYPATQNPAYTQGIRQRALAILNDPNAAVRSFVDVEALKGWGAVGEQNPLSSPFELLVQVEGWLKTYSIESA